MALTTKEFPLLVILESSLGGNEGIPVALVASSLGGFTRKGIHLVILFSGFTIKEIFYAISLGGFSCKEITVAFSFAASTLN